MRTDTPSADQQRLLLLAPLPPRRVLFPLCQAGLRGMQLFCSSPCSSAGARPLLNYLAAHRFRLAAPQREARRASPCFPSAPR
jgi:hypothetical protein